MWRLRGADAGAGEAADPDASADRGSGGADNPKCNPGAGGASGGPAARYEQVASFHGHSDSVLRVAWSPDGALLASGAPTCLVSNGRIDGVTSGVRALLLPLLQVI